MTGCAAEEAIEKRYKPWNEAQDGDPGPLEIKKMLAEALAIGVEFAMSNLVYMFDGVVRKQSRGGL